VAWDDQRDDDGDVYAMRVLASGNLASGWHSNGEALCTASGEQILTDLVSDGAGGCVATWFDQRSGESDVYAGRVMGGGSLPWTADGVAICTATGDQLFPHMASDGMGAWFIAWQDRRDTGPVPVADPYIQRLLDTGSVDSTWPVDGACLGVNHAMGLAQGHEPALVSNGSGQALMSWDENRRTGDPDDPDVYAMRLTSGGLPWVASAPPAPPAARMLRMTPNPARAGVAIDFELAHAAHARLTVLDLQGRRVRDLLDANVEAGPHHVPWDLKDEAQRRVPNEIHFVRLEADGLSQTTLLTIIR
jgi:hypothetical protein